MSPRKLTLPLEKSIYATGGGKAASRPLSKRSSAILLQLNALG
jgi:hypothetical protein